jgi:IclR family transcriptional regulator, pca regulon regulatory protein
MVSAELSRHNRSMPGRKPPEFVEALARGLDVIRAFSPEATRMTVSDIAARTKLARPTVRRLLMTLEHLGYVRSHDGAYSLTARTLELGTAYVSMLGMWDTARPLLEQLVARTGESSSIAQLDGSDIVYTARVPVPKIIAFAVQIGTRFPAVATSMGKVLLADLPAERLDEVLALPSRSNVVPHRVSSRGQLDRELATVRRRGWALSDERLARGIRSAAAPIRSSAGHVVAAVNVTVHAAETSIEVLTERHLPLLLETADAITREWSLLARLPVPDPLSGR